MTKKRVHAVVDPTKHPGKLKARAQGKNWSQSLHRTKDIVLAIVSSVFEYSMFSHQYWYCCKIRYLALKPKDRMVLAICHRSFFVHSDTLEPPPIRKRKRTPAGLAYRAPIRKLNHEHQL